MLATIRQFVAVQAGGVVRVQSGELQEGTTAEVLILTHAATPVVADASGIVDPSWLAFIGMAEDGGRTVEQIDADLRELRDEWDR